MFGYDGVIGLGVLGAGVLLALGLIWRRRHH
ncbi:LPXTG cell wall anchor domain-containing protein [Pseudomonas sp. TNT2022 ID656]|nr:LPXTG cell wall anchor domain-containing protein [Pseudomonas fontis]MDD0976582.1 LPXTG cell wall anchor domain-containing protein [Pseudomonas fontis]